LKKSKEGQKDKSNNSKEDGRTAEKPDEDEVEDEVERVRTTKPNTKSKNSKSRESEDETSRGEENGSSRDKKSSNTVTKEITAPAVEFIYDQIQKTTTILSTKEEASRRDGIVLNTTPKSDGKNEYTANL